MSTRRRSMAAVTAAATTMAITTAGLGATPATADPEGPTPTVTTVDGPASAGSPTQASVTLLTGDVVTVTTHGDDTRTVDITPGPGRDGIPFAQRRTTDGRLRVIPADALGPVGAGTLDPRLFDVTTLIEQGYDDPSADGLPLIIRYDEAPRSPRAATHTLRGAGVAVERELPSIGAAAVTVPAESTGDLWAELAGARDGIGTAASGIAEVHLDGRVHPQLDRSVPRIGAPQVWDAGYTGAGVTVAVLDTGIDEQHPDLADAVLKAEDFTFSDDGPIDYEGHGTHVASIVAGRGTAADGRYTGVAPDADLLIGKVLDWFGGYDSWIIAGMEWAVEHGADVVNLSLGGCATDGSDLLSEAVDALTEQNDTLFVVAAGNHPAPMPCFDPATVSTPAAADHALAVGSVDDADVLSRFSNTGPRLGGGVIKPELTAPGEGVVAARAAGTLQEAAVDEHYARLSGTSMAAPHVAGVAALLAQQHPDWAATELRQVLLGSARPHPDYGAYQQGAGRVDAARAMGQQLFTAPASLSLGLVAWPHGDDDPITETLTYHNTGDDAVTLDLSMTLLGPDGGSAPDGIISVDAEQVTVNAGATADVEITADTSTGAPDGAYSGWITAADNTGSVSVTTPVGVVQEVESYNLTINAVDRTGEPAATEATIGDIGADLLRDVALPAEPVTVRLPAGRYDLTTAIYTEDVTDPMASSLTLVSQPELELRGDTEVTLDARDGETIGVQVDSTNAWQVGQRRAFLQSFLVEWGVSADPDDPNRGTGQLYATPTPEVTSYEYTFGYQTGLAAPAAKKGQPDRGYNLHLTEEGRIPADPTFRVRDTNLVRLDTTLHGQGVDVNLPASLMAEPIVDDIGWVRWEYDVDLPGQRLDLYTEPGTVHWETQLAFGDSVEFAALPSDLDAGKRYPKRWNAAPIGPVLRPHVAFGFFWVTLTPFASSSPGHYAYTPPDDDGYTATTTLAIDGEVVGTSEDPGGGVYDITFPDDVATYEITTQQTREVGWSTLGTEVEATWRLTSGPPEPFETMPFLGLRIGGDVDLLGRAPARRPFRLELTVERADGSAPAVEDIQLEVSFDDGAVWQDVRVRPASDGYVVRLPAPPAGSEFGSLRASVTGTDGSQLEQTVLRAYGLR
ncbi:S8 family peptidase [Phytoactinopolyspora limicola]|uniref:S8 family peptidase n=1 Tax=Phytoactinopolyspora limicola TaxID=2715536 RepID=UPI001409A036|nr:S8 family serine peptidase [Phytoactinopolyspora limicola]